MVSPRLSRRLKSIVSRSNLPASILEKSRMSFNSRISESAEALTVSRYSRCCGSSFVLSTSSVMPRMPFIGMRISWLMFARKALGATCPPWPRDSLALTQAAVLQGLEERK